jgi:circadian clock protein KaiC
MGGELQKVLAVVKMRGSEHSHEFRSYEVTASGAVVGGPLRNYRGIITGVPELELRLSRPGYAGLTDRESAALDALVRLGSASRELLAMRIGLPPTELAQALERLITLGYATVTQDGGSTYRAVAQLGG